MATFYSNLYQLPPNGEPGSVKVYSGPSGPMSVGQPFVVKGQYDNLAALPFGGGGADVLKLCKVPEGSKLLRFYAVPSVDLDASNTFTFNLGWNSVGNAFAAASAGLQAATAFTLAADAVIAAAAAIDGDELVLTRVAGSWANAGTLRFIAELHN